MSGGDVVRPEGLEPPAYWFEATALREIIDLQHCPLLLTNARFQSLCQNVEQA
jgi:hypothetical protein